MTEKINVRAYREGNWWTFEIPELGAAASAGALSMPVGQVDAASKVAGEAQSLAALWTEGESRDFEVSVNFVSSEEAAGA